MGYNIDNDNENKKLKHIDNDIVNSKRVDEIAFKLVDKLSNPNAFKYYCLVAYKLPENKIWNNLEAALKGREPVRLFTWLCKRDMYRG